MTVADFEEEQVLNLDENPASNFAVFNDKTAQIGSDGGALTDNGNGKYTVTNAGAAFTSLQAGDTFSYTAPDGTVSIIKVKSIQKNGGTVIIIEDKNVELEEVFDFVKLEGGYQGESGEPRASAIGIEDGSHSKTERFDWTKRLGAGGLTATLKASGALTAAPYVKVYLALTYQYVELTLTMKANFDCSASGKLARQSVDLLPKELSFTPVVGITLTFMPRMEFEASGNVSFAAEMVTVVGFSCDGKNGLVNKSSGPELTKCDFHVDATVYLGLGLKPGVHVGICNVDVGSLSLDLQVGAEITGKMDASLGAGEKVHLCKQCIAGNITGKLKLDGTLDLMIIGEKTANLANFSKKLTDFYYSFDYKEFGWTVCPHMGSKPIAQGTCGPNLEWRLGEDGTLIVSGTGDMTSWPSASGAPWYYERDKIKSVVLEKGVTSVGAYAFSGSYNYFNLVHAEIPDGVTEIGDHAFSNCGGLLEIVLPGSVSYIGNEAFSGCSKLARANIPERVTTINQRAFFQCSNLREIKIPDNVRVIGNQAFLGCKGLLTLEIPAGVVRIGSYAFKECSHLFRVDIRGGEIGEGAFNICSSLTTVTLGDEVTAIGESAFSDCSSLKSIEIPDQVKNIGEKTFENCIGLTSVRLGNGITGIGTYAFDRCTRLEDIIIPSSVTEIFDRAFQNCTRLSRVYFTGKAPSFSYHWPFVGVVATVYYPANDETWNGKRGDYGGTLTWVPYNPDVPQSAEPNPEESAAQTFPENAAGTQPAVSETPEPAQPEEEPIESQNPSSQEDPNADATFIETTPPTSQASAPAFASATGVVRADNSQTKQFTGLMPGGDYVLLVSKDPNGAGLLQPSNLLYIAQGRADRRGSLTFVYIPRTDESAEAKVCGPEYEAKDIGGCTVMLSKDAFVYDGKAKKPEVTVRDGAAVLERDVDYTVSYEKNVNAGTASVIVAGSGGYAGEKALDFTIQKASGAVTAANVTRTAANKPQSFSIGAKAKGGAKLSYQSSAKSVTVDGKGKVTIAKNFTGKAIITITAGATANYKKAVKKITVTVKAAPASVKPAKTALTGASVSAKSRKMALRWKKAANAAGYQIQYATNRKMKGAKSLNVPGGAKTSKTIGKMAKGKKYYARIRSYRKNAGKTVYSGWSGVRSATMKK